MASRHQGIEASGKASCAYWLSTPVPAGDAAIGAIELSGDVDAALVALGIAPVDVGAARLRDLAGVDRGVVARWSAEQATLMPHAGPAVIAALLDACRRAGLQSIDHAHALPTDGIGELVADALTRVVSPRALDLLLDQPRRWQGADLADARQAEIDDPRFAPACLRHLLREPLVVMVGEPNIGKSSLLNAMAGQGVALVADQRGTTRDAVGVGLVLDGLAVRWIDTPGLSDRPIDAIDAAAQHAARTMIARADLLLIAQDGARDSTLNVYAHNGAHDWSTPSHAGAYVRVRLRSDLADQRAVPGAIETSAHQRRGLLELASAIRSALVPDESLADPRPWRFWM